MKVLTVRQPWASLIILGLKKIENRSWPTRHRGPLAIHAAASKPECGWEDIWDLGIEDDGDAPVREDEEVTMPDGLVLPALIDLPRGRIIGIVTVVDCVEVRELPKDLVDDPFADGPFCWILSQPVALAEPYICKGALGLWIAPAGILEGVT